MIGVSKCRCRKCGAPDAEWRMTIASGRIAASVFSVSTSDSPLETLDACAVIEMVSAPRRLAAISKLVRVRVDASKNRFTTMRPRSRSSFPRPRGWKSRARSRIAWISWRVRFSIPSSPRNSSTLRRPLDQQNFLGGVDLVEFHFDDLVRGGLHPPAGVTGLNGQLAMAAINQNQQLHARGPAVIEQGVERGPDGAAGVQHVVHQNDVAAGDRERDFGAVDHGRLPDRGKIVAIQVDVENADGNFALLQRFNFLGKPLRQGNAPAADADKRQTVQIRRALQNLVRQPHQGAVDFAGAHQLTYFPRGRHGG